MSGVRLAAAGDLLLCCAPGEAPTRAAAAERFAGVRDLLAEADIRLANLECTLPGDGGTVATEPAVVTSIEWIDAVAAAGFDVLCLANNHMFDCLEGGFRRVREALEARGVACFGAGLTLAEARRPAVVERGGVRVALLGGADRRSGTRKFASADGWGVAPLETEDVCRQIRAAREQADHVIVCPHWGEERFLIPAPEQAAQARAWIEAGASAILGHHPHVLQGMQRHAGKPIVYSLGNFAAEDVPFSDGDVMRWSREERTGCLFLAEFGAGGVENARRVATFDDGACVRPAAEAWGRKRLAKVDRALAAGVTPGRYRREHLWVKTVRPTLAHLRWRRLKRLRWRNVRNAWRRLAQAGRAG